MMDTAWSSDLIAVRARRHLRQRVLRDPDGVVQLAHPQIGD